MTQLEAEINQKLPLPAKPQIRLENISKVITNRSTKTGILDGISFSIPEGSLFGLSCLDNGDKLYDIFIKLSLMAVSCKTNGGC